MKIYTRVKYEVNFAMSISQNLYWIEVFRSKKKYSLNNAYKYDKGKLWILKDLLFFNVYMISVA